MAVRITIETSNGREDLWKARGLIDRLLMAVEPAEEGLPVAREAVSLAGDSELKCVPTVEPGKLAADSVRDWMSHLGKRSRNFWKVFAHYLQSHPSVDFESLSKSTGIPIESLRSFHRNSYRAIKDEKAEDPVKKVWNTKLLRMEYTMNPVVRDRILELTDN